MNTPTYAQLLHQLVLMVGWRARVLLGLLKERDGELRPEAWAAEIRSHVGLVQGALLTAQPPTWPVVGEGLADLCGGGSQLPQVALPVGDHTGAVLVFLQQLRQQMDKPMESFSGDPKHKRVYAWLHAHLAQLYDVARIPRPKRSNLDRRLRRRIAQRHGFTSSTRLPASILEREVLGELLRLDKVARTCLQVEEGQEPDLEPLRLVLGYNLAPSKPRRAPGFAAPNPDHFPGGENSKEYRFALDQWWEAEGQFPGAVGAPSPSPSPSPSPPPPPPPPPSSAPSKKQEHGAVQLIPSPSASKESAHEDLEVVLHRGRRAVSLAEVARVSRVSQASALEFARELGLMPLRGAAHLYGEQSARRLLRKCQAAKRAARARYEEHQLQQRLRGGLFAA